MFKFQWMIVLFFVISCSKNQQSVKDQQPNDTVKPFSGLLVTDEYGVPLGEVEVLIGDRPGDPFSDNILFSNAAGKIELPPEWKNPQKVSLRTPGYVTTTYLNISPGPYNFRLREQTTSSQVSIKGSARKFATTYNDGIIDVGLVIPTIHRSDLINFNINGFISPDSVPVSVLGKKLDIPQNISLPKQSEWWGLLKVQFDKENYEVRVPNLGVHRIAAIQAKFNLSDMIRQARQKDLDPLTLLNLVTFENGGAKDLILSSNSTKNEDIDVNQVQFNSKVTVSQTPDSDDDIVLGLSFIKSGIKYFPSDIKVLPPHNIKTLKTNNASDGMVALIQRSKKLERTGPLVDRMSGKILPSNSTQQPGLFSIIDPPLVFVDRVQTQPPIKQNQTEKGAVALLSEIHTFNKGNKEYEQKITLWEVYSSQWNHQFELPQWPQADHRVSGQSYRWEVIYLGGASSSSVHSIGPQIFEESSDFSKNATDFVF